MHTHEEFGALVGKSLVEAASNADVPRVAATQFASAVIAHCPMVKLPALLRKDGVREWMNDARVSESMLRTALTNARKTNRENVRQKDVVRVPPRSRKKSTVDVDAKPAPLASGRKINLGTTEVIPNLSLDLL
ncbi:hypothetical protein [Sphingopyxis sp. USTB-05]|uniref:hypothetical protein n=1 Tax=Sphingopyxis sp. USTB-05 TaxID=2830667 RepID=UPI002078E428|nr:hypothetical protein [Sphingopyxis sp. USTB-05]USI79098.1 hypothetical protein KEC45_09500 [Sphingopyxis sp. USTB-05]